MPKRVNQDRDEGVLSNDLDQIIMANVRGHLRNYGDWKRLSQDTGVSYVTIENYAYGWTTRPHQHTTTRLMEGMGRGEELRAAYACDNPIDVKEALASRPRAMAKRHKAQAKAKKARTKMVKDAVAAHRKANKK